MKTWYIFRLDDITPWMNWKNFNKIEKIFDKFWIKPIIWVVPDNKDKKLDRFKKIDKFWEKIRSLEEKWWIIAQHWYQHKYTTNKSWIIWINRYSEFAWLPYDEQYEKIKKWKEILEKNLKNKIKWWMAPAHSFDKNTCKILEKLWFEYITDWIALFPFKKYNLNWLPQQIWKPRNKLFWIWTICLHLNDYNEDFIKNIENFCEKKKKLIINNPENLNYKNNIIKNLINFIYKQIFKIELFLYKKFIRIINILTFPYRKSKEFKNYWWFLSFLKWIITLIKHKILQKKYWFDDWHILPIEWRPYAQYIYKYINKNSKWWLILEIWCWLWEILNKINDKNKEWYDISENVIFWAREINKNIKYSTWSFDKIKDKDIEFLITVNFPHSIEKHILKDYYANIIENNDIKYIIIDEIKNNNYKFSHNYFEIIPKTYKLVDSSEVFEWNRKILIFKKI